jgi:hypothetical protein
MHQVAFGGVVASFGKGDAEQREQPRQAVAAYVEAHVCRSELRQAGNRAGSLDGGMPNEKHGLKGIGRGFVAQAQHGAALAASPNISRE